MLTANTDRLPTRLIAEWCVTVSRQRTTAVSEQAIRAFEDLMGCEIGGCIEPTPRSMAELAISMGSGPCSIVGTEKKVAAPWAAFANATSAHVLDFDDSFRPLTGHPSCTIIPALLAAAEEYDKTGADVLDAYVVGIEIAATLGRAEPSHHDAGWHATASIGVITTAAACARLLNLNIDQTIAALSIAVSSASGSRMQIGHPVKCIQPGFAARDGVVAAYMAARGITGNEEVFIGPYGFSGLYCNHPQQTPSRYTVPSDSDPLAVDNPGITFKPYPTCGSTHRSIAAVLHLCATHSIAPSDIKTIETIVPFLNTQNLRYNNPKTGMQGRFSMPYTLTLAALLGPPKLSDFEDSAVARADVHAFLPKVTMTTLPGSQNTDKNFLDLPCKTTIIMKDGTSYEDTRFGRPGEREDPLTVEMEAAKFDDCVSGVLTGGESATIRQQLRGLFDGGKVRDFMGKLGQISVP